jgi:hypothetical protein
MNMDANIRTLRLLFLYLNSYPSRLAGSGPPIDRGSDTQMPFITARGASTSSGLGYEWVPLISGYTQIEISSHQLYNNELAYSTLI